MAELELEALVDGANLYRLAFAEGIRPPLDLEVPEWAALERQLQPWVRFPGPWRNERTPYLVEPMRAMSPESGVQDVVLKFGAQVGKTEGLLNVIGFCLDVFPAVVVVVLPKEKDAKKWSRLRLDTLIRWTPSIRRRVSERKTEVGNAVLLKESSNGTMVSLAGANIGSDLRSVPGRFVLMDEVDAFPGEVHGEGDPVALARRAAKSFEGVSTVALVSTPTIKGRSRISREYATTDRSAYLVPCPACGFLQVIGWNGRSPGCPWPQSRMEWEPDDPSSVRMVCHDCGEEIEEGHKTALLAAGEWHAERPELSSKRRGFWLSGLYSPAGFYSWTTAVEEWEKATGTSDVEGTQREGGRRIDQPLLRTFVNTALAEEYEEKGDAPEWEKLYRRRELYERGTVPSMFEGGIRGGPAVLTAGVDIQANRIELEIVAWGRGLESWSIDYVELPGDPSKPDVWKALARELSRTFPVEGTDIELPVRRACVDSGYATSHVYGWVRRQSPDRVLAVKGRDTYSAIVGRAKPVDVSHKGKTWRRGLRVWPLGVSLAKSQLYGWLKMDPPLEDEDPFPPGWCHFPEYDETFFRGLCSEEIRVGTNREGRIVYEWAVVFERNEPLDCRVYALAAAESLGLGRARDSDWEEIEATIGLAGGRAKPRTPKPSSEPGPLDRLRGRRIRPPRR